MMAYISPYRSKPIAIAPVSLQRLIAISLVLLSLACDAGCAGRSPGVVPVKVLGEKTHDRHAFTEGLLIHNATLFESTGRYGASEVRRVDLCSGRVEKRHVLADHYFGEGLARLGRRLYQLTWKSHTGFIYDAKTLAVLGHFDYQGQGWGLTQWHGRLVLSDGSAQLRFMDPTTFKMTRRLRVTDHGQPVNNLNELEVIDGEIWANVWLSDRIVRIDPLSGHVLGLLDASVLARQMPGSAGVLNGIAYDTKHDRIYITGKYWPALFQITKPDARHDGI